MTTERIYPAVLRSVTREESSKLRKTYSLPSTYYKMIMAITPYQTINSLPNKYKEEYKKDDNPVLPVHLCSLYQPNTKKVKWKYHDLLWLTKQDIVTGIGSATYSNPLYAYDSIKYEDKDLGISKQAMYLCKSFELFFKTTFKDKDLTFNFKQNITKNIIQEFPDLTDIHIETDKIIQQIKPRLHEDLLSL